MCKLIENLSMQENDLTNVYCSIYLVLTESLKK